MKSIKVKIVVYIGILLFIVCGGLGLVSYITAANAIQEQAEKTLPQLATEGARVVSERINSVLDTLETVADNDIIQEGVGSQGDAIVKFVGDEAKRSGHLQMFTLGPDGLILSTQTGQMVDLSERDYFKKAIIGERFVSDPIVNKDNGSIVISYAVPIKQDGKIIGVLVALRDGTSLSTITKDIKYGETGNSFMINKKGTTIAHTNKDLVMNMDNDFENVKQDPKLEPLVKLEREMVEGKTGAGEYEYDGVVKYLGYAPIPGTEWSLAIAAPKDDVMSGIKTMGKSVLIASLVVLFLGLGLGYYISRLIATPFMSAAEHLEVISSGDFTRVTPKEFLERNDEIGVLSNAINTMQESVREVVKGVINESKNVEETVLATRQTMTVLTQQIEEVSATTEQLSAGMEETAASSEEMSATATEIERAVNSIAEKAQQGALSAGEISQRANTLNQTAVSSQNSAQSIYHITQEKMVTAIEESKAVDKINVLSEAILQITSQTNLLALNAAIEAARAGEAGRGFAVVADEIRKLAENSKDTVTQIQEVTKLVVSSVGNLSESSVSILEFIDKQVLKDYENMVGISEQYNKDAEFVDSLVTDFSATAQQLTASVQEMTKVIEEIAVSANQGAEGTTNIAQKNIMVVEKANEVINHAERSKESSESLLKIVSRFEV
ncbi:methyl-accepting chemotaxis protein [Desulfosporosinus sp.]|uniref:methyl-accepting chemotaxis protein n=1 Tax=Desulfosporosinus sp. TaxID=157907 RepID=UPI0025C15A7E|nr:methyl-accepting chemotaxis protein [Desulfosporosinus sp.]MBC2724235.1 methyl-accepting chemotaxis protein [Desulfosporosinus sp.]MBC2725648.1 methyl-accepting chemotaxis protein [Desulfosporosinus sp.]